MIQNSVFKMLLVAKKLYGELCELRENYLSRSNSIKKEEDNSVDTNADISIYNVSSPLKNTKDFMAEIDVFNIFSTKEK